MAYQQEDKLEMLLSPSGVCGENYGSNTQLCQITSRFYKLIF